MSDEGSIQQINAAIRASGDLSTVRRKKYRVEDEGWIKALLQRGAFAVMATEYGGQPFLNTHNYVYDEAENCLYLHRNPAGRTSANLELNPRVCCTVAEMGRMLAGESAMEFGVEYASVVVFGTAERVGEPEAHRALLLLMDKYAPHLKPGVDYRPVDPGRACGAAVYKVRIEAWSGKKKEAAPDDPRAYPFTPRCP